MVKFSSIHIIICSYNTKLKYLIECFDSVKFAISYFKSYNNDHIPIYVNICNDGSTDPIVNIYLNKLVKENKNYTLVINDRNMGLAHSINKLLDNIEPNALVINMDSDDIMIFNRILVQYEVMTKYEHFNNITMCATNTVNPSLYNNCPERRENLYNFKILNKKEDELMNLICHPSICYKIDDLNKYNIRYDESIMNVEDWDFFFNVLDHNLNILLIPDALIYYRYHHNHAYGVRYNGQYNSEIFSQLENKWNVKLNLRYR